MPPDIVAFVKTIHPTWDAFMYSGYRRPDYLLHANNMAPIKLALGRLAHVFKDRLMVCAAGRGDNCRFRLS